MLVVPCRASTGAGEGPVCCAADGGDGHDDGGGRDDRTAGGARGRRTHLSAHPGPQGAADRPDGHLVQAHRFAFTLAAGPIPGGLVVRHTCDNPPCCNPTHLVLGTQGDNIGDMRKRGRASGGATPRPGETHPNSKITDLQAEQIKARRVAGEAVTALAAEFGLSKSQVSRITTGKRRAALDQPVVSVPRPTARCWPRSRGPWPRRVCNEGDHRATRIGVANPWFHG